VVATLVSFWSSLIEATYLTVRPVSLNAAARSGTRGRSGARTHQREDKAGQHDNLHRYYNQRRPRFLNRAPKFEEGHPDGSRTLFQELWHSANVAPHENPRGLIQPSRGSLHAVLLRGPTLLRNTCSSSTRDPDLGDVPLSESFHHHSKLLKLHSAFVSHASP